MTPSSTRQCCPPSIRLCSQRQPSGFSDGFEELKLACSQKNPILCLQNLRGCVYVTSERMRAAKSTESLLETDAGGERNYCDGVRTFCGSTSSSFHPVSQDGPKASSAQTSSPLRQRQAPRFELSNSDSWTNIVGSGD